MQGSSASEHSADAQESTFLRITEIDFEIAQQEERMAELQRLFMSGDITDHTKNPEMEAASYNIQKLEAERARLSAAPSELASKSRLRRLGSYLFGRASNTE